MLDHGVRPLVDETSRPFWDGIARNEFVVGRCAACGSHLFPAREICGGCHGRDVVEATVTGPGRVYSFTINHQPWGADYAEPYAVLVVDYESYGVRLLGLANVDDMAKVSIGAKAWLDCVTFSNGQSVPAFALSPPAVAR